PVERCIQGENLAVYDAAPRISGVPPASDAFSSLRTEPGARRVACHRPGAGQPTGLGPGASGLGASGRGVSSPGGFVLPGGLSLQGNRGNSGRANGHREVQNRPRHCPTPETVDGQRSTMNSEQAKEILIIYRPGTADREDPDIAAALELAKADTELA